MFLVVGISTMDLFISGLRKMPAFGGDEFTVDNLAFSEEPLTMAMGGNGAICAYVLAKLGAQVALGSAIGHDALGDIANNWLTEAGVDLTGLIRSRQAATSTTTVVTDRRFNRVSFHHPGVSNIYRPLDLPHRLLRSADIVILASYPLLPHWRPDGANWILAEAKRLGSTTALDIGPAIGRPAALAELRPLLRHVDFFICNGHELAVCTGIDYLHDAMSCLIDEGAGCVVVKRGSQGAVVRRAGEELLTIPAFVVDAKFTVGAGDSFNAALLFGVRQGWNIERALQFANAVAAYVVSAARGVLGAPDLDQALHFLAQNSKTS